jgi:hypothetical protein
MQHIIPVAPLIGKDSVDHAAAEGAGAQPHGASSGGTHGVEGKRAGHELARSESDEDGSDSGDGRSGVAGLTPVGAGPSWNVRLTALLEVSMPGRRLAVWRSAGAYR